MRNLSFSGGVSFLWFDFFGTILFFYLFGGIVATILVDMDGVLANFNLHVANQMKRIQQPSIPPEEINKFYIENCYRDKYGMTCANFVYNMKYQKEFFKHIPPIEGAIRGIINLSMDHDVRICTKPVRDAIYCIQEKEEWVRFHLGTQFERRMLVTHTKAIYQADYLIDDRPDIKFDDCGTWKHVLFHQPYNVESKCHDKVMKSWSDLSWLK